MPALIDRLTQHPLSDGNPPLWASAWGHDRFGPWAELAVETSDAKTATQRLRWIPPGRFLMGSPESEAGRSANEGPRHEVEISQGYWLFDTPCTQALWMAVMGGRNPSEFLDPLRPVETVSFDDVEEFITKINGMVKGLDLSLPTEAQWEYACRAGTTTATYAGDLQILGVNNAPVLDAIAWYGGNSGHEYDLENGVDSNEWPEKQYPHSKAGTRQVGQKVANGWGLYDMLGNVWEWCRDGMRIYKPETEVDPMGPRGARRVIRGGGWDGDARFVRAASRDAFHAGYRGYDLGFRCLSSGR